MLKPLKKMYGNRKFPLNPARRRRVLGFEEKQSILNTLKKKYLGEKPGVTWIFKNKSDSPLFIAKETLLRVLKSQLGRRQLNLGLSRRQTHQGFSPYLLGYHNNLSQINLDLTTYCLRKNLRFLLAGLLRNYRMCVVSHEIQQFFDKQKLVMGYHLIFDYWIPGTVSNFKNLSKQKVRKEQGFIKRFPQFLVALRLNPYKFYSISNEAQRAGVPIICFLDTDLDPTFFNFFLPVNTKQFLSFNYNLFLLTMLIRRSLIIKKLKFFRKKLKKPVTLQKATYGTKRKPNTTKNVSKKVKA